MSEDKNTEKRGAGRYSRRTRRKFYYFKAWLAGLGAKKLTLLAVAAVLVIDIPIGAGVGLNRRTGRRLRPGDDPGAHAGTHSHARTGSHQHRL